MNKVLFLLLFCMAYLQADTTNTGSCDDTYNSCIQNCDSQENPSDICYSSCDEKYSTCLEKEQNYLDPEQNTNDIEPSSETESSE
jgi:hypothetical protein